MSFAVYCLIVLLPLSCVLFIRLFAATVATAARQARWDMVHRGVTAQPTDFGRPVLVVLFEK